MREVTKAAGLTLDDGDLFLFTQLNLGTIGTVMAEPDHALHRGSGAVAGLADPHDLPALLKADLHAPPVRVPFDQLGGGGGKVGGDHGELVAIRPAGWAGQHDLDRLRAKRAVP